MDLIFEFLIVGFRDAAVGVTMPSAVVWRNATRAWSWRLPMPGYGAH